MENAKSEVRSQKLNFNIKTDLSLRGPQGRGNLVGDCFAEFTPSVAEGLAKTSEIANLKLSEV